MELKANFAVFLLIAFDYLIYISKGWCNNSNNSNINFDVIIDLIISLFHISYPLMLN